MYAIVDILGKQFRVEQGQELKVPFSGGDSGTNVLFEKVLLIGEESKTQIGQPVVPGAAVDATILEHGRDRKITVFKFKRRKGYKRTQGHRQDFTRLRINGITVGKAKAAKAAPAADSADPEKKAAPKKAATKKPAAKKAPAKKPAAKKDN